jgi:hypothetical protein
MAIKFKLSNIGGADNEQFRYVVEPEELDERIKQLFEAEGGLKDYAVKQVEYDLIKGNNDVLDLIKEAVGDVTTNQLASLTATLEDTNTKVASHKDDLTKAIEDIEGNKTTIGELNTNLTEVRKNSIPTIYTYIGLDTAKTELFQNTEKSAELKTGDLAVVTEILHNGLYKYLTFICDVSNNAANGTRTVSWLQISGGNSSATEIYFPGDIIITKSLGRYIVDEGSTTTLPWRGKNLVQAIQDAFAQGVGPTVTQPSLSFTFEPVTAQEVGTRIGNGSATIKIGTLKINIGKYEKPDQATGVNFTDLAVTTTDATNQLTTKALDETETVSNITKNIDIYMNTNNAKWTDDGYSISCSYTGKSTAGVVPTNSLGQVVSAKQILAVDSYDTTVTNSVKMFKGFHSWYIGGSAVANPSLNSDFIKSIYNAKYKPSEVGTEITIKAADFTDCKNIIVAIPSSANKVISKVYLKSASNADITSDFIIQADEIPVADTSDYIPETTDEAYAYYKYYVWKFEPTELDSSCEFTIQFKNKEVI